MNVILFLARTTIVESSRRRLFIVVPIVTALFLALYWTGNHYAFQFVTGTTRGPAGLVDTRSLAGASLVGLSMFMTMFLSSVIGVFLTMSTVRGDAESGLLQTFVVRPVARWQILVARFLGACAIAVPYALFLFIVSLLMTKVMGDWFPSQPVVTGLELAAAVSVVVAISLLGSVFLSTIANGVVAFMVYGAGLLGGLLGQIGEALRSPGLLDTGRNIAWAFPFEALYQAALDDLTVGESGVTRVIVQLGPLGGAQAAGVGLWLWAVVYLVIVGLIASAAFARRDL